MKKFSIRAMGFSLGLTWAMAILLLSCLAYFFNWGNGASALIADIYPGYEVTVLGTLVGMAWGFVDLFIAGIIFATLYNLFLPKKK